MTRNDATRAAFNAAGCVLGDNVATVYETLRLAGFAVVPLEPTHAMLHALFVLPDFAGTTIIRHTVDKLPGAYRAMIAAYEKEQGDG